MDRFSEIIKGRTYLHQPNQALNLYLTATVVIVVAKVLGLGVGHFKGWSERLELQEQYADIREERMEELTDSLVSCMTGNLFKYQFSETHFDVGIFFRSKLP